MDLWYEHVPVWTVTQKALLAGESPFWIEGEYCGHPALLLQEAPLFYPLTVPLLLTGAPAHRLVDLFSLFHFWLAGFSAFLLLRDLKAQPVSALFGGVAWMLSARMVQSALWPNAVAVLSLLPFLLLGVLRIGRGQRRSGILCTAISGGLACLASRPQALLGSVPLIASVVVATALQASRRRRVLADLALAGLLAALLGAPATVPGAALYRETHRAGGLTRTERELSGASGRDVEQFFLPVDGGSRWPEAAAYPGLVAGALFLMGIAMARRLDAAFPRALFASLALGGAIGLAFAFGENGPYRLLAELPLFRSLRIPERYLISWSLAIAIGSAIVLSHAFKPFRRRQLLTWLCVLALSGDLIHHARQAAPTALSAIYSIEPSIVPALRARLSRDELGFPRRFWSGPEIPYLLFYRGEEQVAVVKRFEPLYLGLGMRFGLESAGGWGLTLKATEALFRVPRLRAAELAGVACVVVPLQSQSRPGRTLPPPPAVHAFSALPRAILVPEALVVAPSRALAATLDPNLNPRRTAILEEGEPLRAGRDWEGKPSTIRLLSRGSARIELMARLPEKGVLLVFNSFERGWRALVDGKSVPLLRADSAFLGLRLDRGVHRVRLFYRPPGLLEGLGLAMSGALGCVLLAVRRERGI